MTHSRAAAAATAAASAAVTQVLRRGAVEVTAADAAVAAAVIGRMGLGRRWRHTRACSGRMAVRFAPVGG